MSSYTMWKQNPTIREQEEEEDVPTGPGTIAEDKERANKRQDGGEDD